VFAARATSIQGHTLVPVLADHVGPGRLVTISTASGGGLHGRANYFPRKK